MEFEVVVTYDKRLARRAVNHYFARSLGPYAPIALGIAVGALLWFYKFGPHGLLLTTSFFITALLVSLVIAAYLIRIRQSDSLLGKMRSPTVTHTFSGDGVASRSDLGTSTLKWAAFDQVMEFEDMWLLRYAQSAYLTLPLAALPMDCRALIQRCVRDGASKPP